MNKTKIKSDQANNNRPDFYYQLDDIDAIAYDSGCFKVSRVDPDQPSGCGYIINYNMLRNFAESIVKECLSEVSSLAYSLSNSPAGADRVVSLKDLDSSFRRKFLNEEHKE